MMELGITSRLQQHEFLNPYAWLQSLNEDGRNFMEDDSERIYIEQYKPDKQMDSWRTNWEIWPKTVKAAHQSCLGRVNEFLILSERNPAGRSK